MDTKLVKTQRNRAIQDGSRQPSQENIIDFETKVSDHAVDALE